MSETKPALSPLAHAPGGMNRRALFRASAGLGVAAAVAGNLPRGGSSPQVAHAQEADGTRARSWDEADNISTDIKLDGEGWITLRTEFPFWALGFGWDSSVGMWPAVQFGVSVDGDLWDDGYDLSARDDGGPAPADDRLHTDLFFSDGQQYVRYRTVDGEGNLVVLDRFQVTYIDPTDGPWEPDRGATLMRTAATNSDTRVPPSIITRAQWGADESLRKSGGSVIWPPQYAKVEHAIVHHAAATYGSDGYLAVRSIYYYHAVTQGWGDIGYNYVVDVHGNIFEGRVGGANVIGGHAYQYAIGSSGICVMGNFTTADAPQAAKVALANIISYVVRDLDPFGSKPFHEVPSLPTIAAHRDVIQSGCPGDGLYDDLPWIRQTVANTLNNGLLDSHMPGGIVPGDWVTVQTGDGSTLSMRAQPGIDQLRVENIPSGTRVEVERGPLSDSQFNWYLVMYNNRSGWVVADYLVVDTPPSVPVGQQGYAQNVLLGTNVPLKRSPGTTAATIATESGTWAILLAGPSWIGNTRWFLVRTQTGKEGWISDSQFTMDQITAPASAWALGTTVQTVAKASILVRPGIGQTAQATVAAGTRLTISVKPVGTTGKVWYGVYGGTGIGGGWIDSAFLGAAAQPVTKVGQSYSVIETMNFRAGAGSSAAVIGTLAAGSTGTVIGGPTDRDGHRWWNLRTSSGSTGWASGTWLTATGSPGTPPPTTTPPPAAGKFAAGDGIRVTESLNMRSGPGTGNGVVNVLAAGTTGKVLEGPTSGNGYTWWRIQTSAGTGWVVETWLAKTSSSTPPPTTTPPPAPAGKFITGDGVRITETLNMRSGAGTGNSVVAVLGAGITGKVLEGPRSGNGYTWWRIQTGSGTGWAAENWLAKTSSATPPPSTTPPPASVGKFAVGDGIRVSETLNMRSGAGTSNGVVAVLGAGTTGKVLEGPRSGNGYTWWRVQTDRGTGWVVETWIAKTSGTSTPPATSGKFAIGTTVRVTEALNLRSGAGTGNRVIAILPVGTTGRVSAGPTSANGYTWWSIETSLGTGWAVQDWLAK